MIYFVETETETVEVSLAMSDHNHKKRTDSLETRAEQAVFVK